MAIFDLTPGEAMVLLDPDLKQGRNPFKVSLMWLLAQRHLKATEVRRGLIFKRKTTRFSKRREARGRLPADLQVVKSIVLKTGTGMMDDVVKAATERFGAGLLGFQNEYLYPALERRRLIHRTQKQQLLFFKRECWAHTPAGKALATRVEALFEDARRIPEFLDRSPAQAAALAASLGGLILLVPELRPYLNDIATVMRQPTGHGPGGGDTGSSTYGGSDAPAARNDEPGSRAGEQPHFNFDFSDFDSGGFDGLDASLAELDSSFDSSSSDSGGGDGGGGDGGGGGD